jgi:NAD(P)-dependent dehydrogenase (short-subunit alcohol dehydrogenase family)
MRGLKGKRVIIGGGATGMGAALAVRLLTEGANVLVGDINDAGLKKLAGEMAGKGNGLTQVFDLADEASILKLVGRAAEEFKGIDGLVITGADLSKATLGNDNDLMHMDPKIWERTFKVNVLGHALLMKATIPHMKAAGGGSIVSVSSGAAYAGSGFMPAYAVSKAGLHALARHTARIAGKDNIRCNVVAPGTVLTEGAAVNMTDDMKQHALSTMALTRLGAADDLASALAFLISDEASWLTGQVISVNGGTHFRD